MRLQRMLGLAFLGGLILNLMPCVFPVLAMKVVGLAGAARSRARLHAAAYTAGVLVAFAVVGAALLAARAAGAAAGWGFQFQSPAFVAAMAWLLFAVGLNLSGVFQIGTGLVRCRPGTGRGIAAAWQLLHRAAGGGGGDPMHRAIHGGRHRRRACGPAGGDDAGVPRHGPGHGGALRRAGCCAGAVARGAEARALDGGAAAGAGIPDVCRERLAGLGDQPGGRPVRRAWHAAGLVLLGFAAWVLGITQGGTDRGRRVGQSAAAAALLAALAVLSGIAVAPAAPTSAAEAGAEPFSPARLAALRAEGRPVFVNMTAAWCVTCLVNERVAISSEAVRQAFAERRVTYLKGDWTRQDPEITDFLRENGRDGVPLYVYYPPHGQPAVLPQILTENMLLRELDHG